MNSLSTQHSLPSDAYQFVVLGGGSAGYAAARTAAEAGLKTAVIEGGEKVGGLCILRGCMPSKTLIESASRFQAIHEAEEFGISVSDAKVNVAKIIARKRRLIGEFADYREEQLRSGKFDFIRGRASFVSAHEIVVETDDSSRRIHAETVLISTGSSISIPEIAGLREVPFYISDDILELENLPQSMIVLGAGAVGLEMAYYLNALGVEVTVIQRSPHVLRGLDEDVSDTLQEALRGQGIQIFTDTQVRKISQEGDVIQVDFTQGGTAHVVSAEKLLNALGRHPRIEDLHLEAIGVAVKGGRILADATQQTSVEGIYAAGDVCGPHEIVHIAIEQGEVAARNAARYLKVLSGPEETMDYRLKLFVTFTLPEVATCGWSEEEAAKEGMDIMTAKYPFDDHGKSLIGGHVEGFVKLIVESKSRMIVGASCIGPHASDLIQEIVVAMAFRATAGDLARIPHYHPTLSEIWTYPAEELMETGQSELL